MLIDISEAPAEVQDGVIQDEDGRKRLYLFAAESWRQRKCPHGSCPRWQRPPASDTDWTRAMPRSAARALAFSQATRVSGLFCSAMLTSSGKVYIFAGSRTESGKDRGGALNGCFVDEASQGWSGEEGAFWPNTIPSAATIQSMMSVQESDKFVKPRLHRTSCSENRALPFGHVLHKLRLFKFRDEPP